MMVSLKLEGLHNDKKHLSDNTWLQSDYGQNMEQTTFH
jgi:hypothetical protein